jgi:hypothetical protein
MRDLVWPKKWPQSPYRPAATYPGRYGGSARVALIGFVSVLAHNQLLKFLPTEFLMLSQIVPDPADIMSFPIVGDAENDHNSLDLPIATKHYVSMPNFCMQRLVLLLNQL